MALAVPGCARHEFLSRDDTRRLVGAGQTVDVGAKRDDRVSRPVACNPRRGDARHRTLHVESLTHEHVGQMTLGFGFLKPELAVAEELIDQLLGEDAARLHVGHHLFLQRFRLLAGRCELDRRSRRWCRTSATLRECRRSGHRGQRDDERQDTSDVHGVSPLSITAGVRPRGATRRGWMKVPV